MVEGGTPTHRTRPTRSEPLAAPGGERKQPAGPRLRATVLVVDDDDAIRDFLRSALEYEGYAVLAAGDGLDALTLCERYTADVILLDLMMPRLDGMAFLTRYRRQHGSAAGAVYVMSAVRAVVEQAVTEDVDGMFVKPFDLDELLETVAGAIERRRERLSAQEHSAALRTPPAPARLAGRPH